ncbi:OmpL47-type beta-barrel domain-containing protein [Leifsonia sp. NPDC058230]|uniref:OmpL47-type beta-barrel domain-containing protein n=1 Tax=Leifsonia sp. NPDC058230 TaxID=3346391 RepID=UPI0036D7EEDD
MLRTVKLTRSLVAVGAALLLATMPLAPASAAPAAPSPPSGPNPADAGNPFIEHNGLMWEYVRDPEGFDGFEYPATTYQSITNKIDDGWYTQRGIHHIGIYGAWKSTPEFLGLPPLDYFDAQTGTGTIDDFRDMVQSANAHGLTVVMYIELIYIHPDNPVFVKAAQDRADDVDSFESRMFRWDDRPQPQAECPSDEGLPGEVTWTRDPSIANGRCYVQAWGELGGTLPKGYPAFDFEKPEAMQYAKQVMGFWMNLGVQGFTFDAPQTYLGMQGSDEAKQSELLDFAKTYVYPDGKTRPQWLDAEGAGTYTNMAYTDRVGYSVLYGDSGDDFNSAATQVARTPQTVSVDQLDDFYSTWVDSRRQNGRGGWGTSVFDFDEQTMPGDLRALDAAVQAGGAGLLIFNHQQTLNANLSADDERKFYDVFRTIDRSSALAPGASRVRIPTQDDSKLWAVLRQSTDKSKSALALFNFHDQEQCVTVNLGGSGITVPQRTTDLADGEPGPWLRTDETTFRLPAYGYAFLDVDAGHGFDWNTVDSSASGWNVGGGWNVIDDPSAFGGSRIGGNAPGGFAERTFEGDSVQLWGRMATDGGTQVRVFVDGQSVGDHTQRRSAPIPGSGGNAFYGQKLVSLSGLGAGSHTIRLEQINGAAGNAGGTGIDYMLTSDQTYVAPTAVTGGDRCADDATPPQTTATLSPEGVGGGYVNPKISLESHDESSGVARIEYRLDGGQWTEYESPVAVTSPGSHELEYRATDVAGNVEATKSRTFTVSVDSGPPVVSASIDHEGANGWHLAGAQLTLSATDDSGIQDIDYRLDDGTWTPYDSVVDLPEGAHVVHYRATDTAGNTSAEGSITAKVDATSPSIQGWVSETGQVVAVGTDAESGIRRMDYSTDGDHWFEGLSAFRERTGSSSRVWAQAMDTAGNRSDPVLLSTAAGPHLLTVDPGSALLVQADGYQAREVVRVELHSEPITLGRATADAFGTISILVRVPTSFPGGTHALVLAAEVNDPRAALAVTGSDQIPLLLAGAGVLLAGLATFGTVIFRRRRERRL